MAYQSQDIIRRSATNGLTPPPPPPPPPPAP
ncbi:hypothetical protein, partial [Escherichia coli]